MQRREFHKLLGLGAAAGLSLPSLLRAQPQHGDAYHLPRFGNVHLMHMTDVHAQPLQSTIANPPSISECMTLATVRRIWSVMRC